MTEKDNLSHNTSETPPAVDEGNAVTASPLGAEEPEGLPAVTYATPIQRLWAWVGVVYMLILLCLVTYYLATASFISGIGGIMIAPALFGVSGSTYLQRTAGTFRGSPARYLFTLNLSLALAVYGLVSGVSSLLARL